MFEDLKKQIDAHNIISFDIFDTLIIRAYDKPTDLFKHMEISKKVDNFQRLRIDAEARARQKAYGQGLDETTIDEIYEELPAKLLPLKDVEVEQEINVCFQDKYMYEIYNYAKSQNKKVIITSDMYLNKPTIETILEKNGYTGYDKLFLSSDIKLCKASGRLFEEIIKQMNCQASDILHIGDNKFGDYKKPLELGVDCWFYQTAKKINENKETKRFMRSLSEHCDEIPVSIAKSLILKRDFDNYDAWENFGYKYAGLMFYGYCLWLYEQFQEHGFKKIIFASRDGYIPMQIFLKYYPEFDSSYFYASRRAYIFAGMTKVDDTLLSYLVDQAGSNLTFAAYWNSLKIEDKILTDKFSEAFDLKEKITDASKDMIKRFFLDNANDLLSYAQKERKISMEYFKQVGLSGKKVAFIDIGWRASIQRNIMSVFKQEKKTGNIFGFYLATHPFNKKTIKLKPFLMDQNEPTYIADIVNPLISIFELICSAPHLGCVKIVEKNGKYVPLEQSMNPNEKKRLYASKKIMNGVLDFVENFVKVTQKLPVKISPLASVTPFIKFFDGLNDETEKVLSTIGYVTGMGDANNYNELYPHFDKNNTISVVYTWPNSVRSGEVEFVNRLKIAAANIGYKIAVISKEGHVLDNLYRITPQTIKENDVKFNIIIHYDDFKSIDAFTYKALWNPPCITLQHNSYPYILRNIVSNDDYFIYDDGGMYKHLEAMLIDTPRQLNGASFLSASFPASAIKKPEIVNTTLFYCGINWEKMIGTEARHEGLFHLLDKLDNVKFFGPEETWKGYKNYQYSIPFDGFSLVNEAHNCGVVLALSSDFHYRAGAATNRVYEGCVAGAVIISDTNRFIKKHFGDSILYVDFDKDNPERMFRQIKGHLDWINNNKKDALKLAQKSQKIFLEKFTLEKQLLDIINNHENRKRAVAQALYSQKQTKTLAVYFADTIVLGDREKELLENTVKNIEKQVDKNIILAVCCEKEIEKEVKNFISSLNTNVEIILNAYLIFDQFNYKWMTRGQMLYDVINKISHDYLCILDGYEIMFSDHITTLKRTLENHPNKIAAYSGTFLDSQNSNRYRVLDGSIKPQEIYDCIWPNKLQNVSGSFLMAKSIETNLTKFIAPYVDGLEVSVLLNMSYFKFKQKFVYSQRLTCSCKEDLITPHPITMDRVKQINFIHGLISYDYEEWVGEIPYIKQSGSSLKDINFSKHLLKWIRKIYRHKLGIEININKFLKLFIFNKKQRSRLKEKIKKLKAEKKQLKGMK